MKIKSEALLRAWNNAAIVFVASMAALPNEFLPQSPPSSLSDFVWMGVGALILAGFWFRMLHECVTVKRGHQRVVWLLLFVALPIFSALIFFATSRSVHYEQTMNRT